MPEPYVGSLSGEGSPVSDRTTCGPAGRARDLLAEAVPDVARSIGGRGSRPVEGGQGLPPVEAIEVVGDTTRDAYREP